MRLKIDVMERECKNLKFERQKPEEHFQSIPKIGLLFICLVDSLFVFLRDVPLRASPLKQPLICLF
jgi:hypothetical protein